MILVMTQCWGQISSGTSGWESGSGGPGAWAEHSNETPGGRNQMCSQVNEIHFYLYSENN